MTNSPQGSKSEPIAIVRPTETINSQNIGISITVKINKDNKRSEKDRKGLETHRIGILQYGEHIASLAMQQSVRYKQANIKNSIKTSKWVEMSRMRSEMVGMTSRKCQWARNTSYYGLQVVHCVRRSRQYRNSSKMTKYMLRVVARSSTTGGIL